LGGRAGSEAKIKEALEASVHMLYMYILRPSLVPRLLWFSAGEEPEYEAN